MANTIRLKRASGSDPGASDLVTGELAVRTDTAKLFTKKDDNSVVEIGATVSSDAVDTAAIQDDAVTFAKIQNISQNKFAGRISSGTGNLEQLTAANVRSIINVEDGATADQSNSEIKTAYEANSNTNAFTDALLSKLNGIAASATNVTNNNQLTNGAGYITATLTNEQVQDIVGGMVSSNTESGITVTYQDSDGTLDFSVASQTDNNFTNADHSKLDGIEAGATADQTASEILTLIKTVDGAGSGLDADTLDGISSASFVRSDASDTLTGGTYTLNNSEAEKIILQGASNPFIRFQEGTTDKAYVQWHSDGYLQLANAEDGSRIRIKDDLRFTTDNFSSTNYKIWHAGNDGSGSGLDADTLDGIDSGSFLRSNAADVMSQSTQGTATLDVRNTGGAGSGTGTGALIARFEGDSDFIEIRNIGGGDYGIYNSQQDNGFELYDGTGGVRILYNGAISVEFDSGNTYGDFKGVPTVNGTSLVRTSDTIASATNADTVDSLHASSFLRSDTTDTASSVLTLTSGLSFGADAKCAAGVSALSDGSTITVNFTSGIHHSVTLGGNRTFGNPSNDANAVGQSGSIFITQDGTGSRTASFHSDYKFAGGTAPTLSTAANAVDRLDYVIKASGVIHCVVTLDVK